MNDLVGFIVALVALRVCLALSLEIWTPNWLSAQDLTASRHAQGLIFRMATSSIARSILQRCLPSRTGHEHLFAKHWEVYFVAASVLHCSQSWSGMLTVWMIDVENPMLVMIMGCVGLTLNIISALFLHGKEIRAQNSNTRSWLY